MIQIVHVVAAGEIGGAERMLLDLVRGDDRHSVALLTPNEALRALFRENGVVVDDRGANVKEGPLSYLASTFGSADVAWLAGVLERRRASIVHLHTFASQVIGTRAAEKVRARIVRTEHSTRVYDDPTCWPFARWSLPRANAVVFISEHVRNAAFTKAPFLREPRRDPTVIHNGVDTARFAPAPLRDDVTRFVALGRLDPRKGLDLALEALTRVSGATLDIVGTGNHERVLRATVDRLGLRDRARFVGYRDDVRAAIADADVVLSSAVTEGLGIAILEAMAMGRPACVVPVGGLVEIVENGTSGWVATDRSAPALAAAMLAATDRPERERRGLLARKRVEEKFSLEAMRRSYETVYARVAH